MNISEENVKIALLTDTFFFFASSPSSWFTLMRYVKHFIQLFFSSSSSSLSRLSRLVVMNEPCVYCVYCEHTFANLLPMMANGNFWCIKIILGREMKMYFIYHGQRERERKRSCWWCFVCEKRKVHSSIIVNSHKVGVQCSECLNEAYEKPSRPAIQCIVDDKFITRSTSTLDTDMCLLLLEEERENESMQK